MIKTVTVEITDQGRESVEDGDIAAVVICDVLDIHAGRCRLQSETFRLQCGHGLGLGIVELCFPRSFI